ncbi:PqqD family protein [Chloroflexota bacterium]
MENLKGKILGLKEDHTLVSVEDKAALLDVGKRCYYDLNDTAFFLLKLMEGGCLYEDIQAGLVSEFDVSEGVALLDTHNFIEEVLRLGLVEISEEPMARRGVSKPEKEKKAYQTPLLEQETEIVVAQAFPPPTAGPKWA